MLRAKAVGRPATRKIGDGLPNLVGVLLLILTVVPRLQAVEPELRELQPSGAQRGKTFALTLTGEALESGAEIITTLPATISRLAPPKDLQKPDSELLFLVQLPDDAPVGLYPIRVHTENGLSNVLIFSVGDLPEVSEKEPNNSIDQAQPITVPVTVNGSLTAADQDFYRLSVKAHERLVMEVEARRMASAIDPVIEVLDASGHRIAFNDDAPGLGVDARVDLIFPKTGNYYIVVHDSKYSDQERKFYRLKVGSYAYAEGIFPLGGQRGQTADVTFFGGNLEKPVKVHAKLDVLANQHILPINIPGPKPIGSLPFQFQVGDFPEVLAQEDGSVAELQPSTVVNGRIGKPGQVDRFKLKVSPGQQWLLELDAASLGTSRLYGGLTVLNQQGKELPADDVAEGPDPKLAFKVPDKVREVTLAVRDLRNLGGPAFGYRLVALPQASGFSLKVLTPYVNIPADGVAAIEVLAERNGYDGPIQLGIPDLPEDLVMEGGHIAAIAVNYAGARPHKSHGYLTVKAKPDARARKLLLSVWGEGGSADNPVRPIRRRAEGLGLAFNVNEEPVLNLTGDPVPQKPVTAEWLGMELPAAVTKPRPVTLLTSNRNFRLAVGMRQPIEWKLLRQGPGIEPVRLSATLEYGEVRGLELEGAEGGKTDVAGKDSGTLVLRSQPDTPLVKFDMVVSATVKINGKEENVLAPAVTVDLVRGYSIALVQDRAELKGGGEIELAGTVQREPSFATPVKIKVADPPDKVSCAPIEVPEDKSEFRVVCEAAPDVQAGDFEIHLLSSAVIPGRNDQREYNFPPLAAHLVVAGGKASQTVARRQ
jgi:hypothetical protein